MAFPSKDQAEVLLNQHVKEPYQILHAHMVAKALEGYADKYQGDKDLWYITGLLHDLDYYEFPLEHPDRSVVWFKEWGYSESLIDAVEAHGLKEPRVAPKDDLAKVLIASDELCGLFYAYSLMRPDGMKGMEAKSVAKKFKDKAFAAKISREEITYGVDLLGLELKEHIANLISFLG